MIQSIYLNGFAVAFVMLLIIRFFASTAKIKEYDFFVCIFWSLLWPVIPFKFFRQLYYQRERKKEGVNLCPFCNGTGYDKEREMPCRACKGTGIAP